MADLDTQLAVIGGGPGGYAAAFMAADLGLQVTLIDPQANPGGVCLYRGCIPSKTLLHAAKVIQEAKEAEAWGLTFSSLAIDAKKLRRFKNQVVAQLTGGLGQLVKRRNINHIQGTAVFDDNQSLTVSDAGGGKQTVGFGDAIIASGSHPVIPAAFDVESPRLLNSTSALELNSVPNSLLVVGGGYIGLELGTVYAALGTDVTVVEMLPGLLPGADPDLVRYLQRNLKKRFASILVNTTVKSIKAQKNGIKVWLEGKNVDAKPRLFDHVLVAVGRRPRTAGLGLENTSVVIDDKGFISVDDQRRTASPHIYAIGDVAGEPMLAHKASHEGRLAAEVIAGRKVSYNPAAIPAVVFTDPEIAWAGLTETEAKQRGINYEVAKFPWGASGRAVTLGKAEGQTKLLADPDSGRVLGVAIVGAGAGELIAEGVLAIEMAANVTDVGQTIHPHPTLSETVMEAADIFHGSATHVFRPPPKAK
jgi:dihydrolipoamide dehydrogenase